MEVVPLSEFEIHFYTKFATTFVSIYFDGGKMAAGVYAVENIKKENLGKAKPFIDEEFIRRGYDISEGGAD